MFGGRTQRNAAIGTVAGFMAVLLWALLALFTTGAEGIPPFQLVAMTFALAFALALPLTIARGGVARLAVLRQPVRVWLLGVGGLFGYHFFYFLALANAPPADASLIAYLWPLLIVVFSALLPGERLRWFHVAGALSGFAGAGLLVTDGGQLAFDDRYALGYLAAGAGALVWSSYSVLNRSFKQVPTDVVGGFCGAVAVLGALCHLAFEKTVLTESGQWVAIAALGLGPVGAAFFLWDYGTKHGRIQVLGVSSYAAPLLSTLTLVAFGRAPATPVLAVACLLIVLGAVIASADMLHHALAARRDFSE